MITLHKHLRSDIPNRIKWLNNSLASKYIGDYAGNTNEQEQNGWFDRYEVDNGKEFFTIRHGIKPIGFVGLSKINTDDNSADIFIIIGEDDYRGKGYGSKSLQLLLDYAFNNLGLKKLTLCVKANNMPAINLYTKFGFKKISETDDGLEMILLK